MNASSMKKLTGNKQQYITHLKSEEDRYYLFSENTAQIKFGDSPGNVI